MATFNENGFKASRDSFGELLNEANEMFVAKHGTNIIGEDFKTVVTNNSLFEAYKNKLTEGFDPKLSEAMETMMDNSRIQLMQESTIQGIQPFASLSMPILVKLWARLTLTQALPTEPASTPAFTIPFMKPYMADAEGNKYYLPESINQVPEKILNMRTLKENVAAVGGKITGYDLFTGIQGIKPYDTVDRKFTLTEATWSDSFDMRLTTPALGSVDLKIKRIALSPDGKLYADVTYPTDAKGGTAKDTIMGAVDTEGHILNLVSMNGKLTAVKIRGFVSSEAHTKATQFSFDIDRKDIMIGNAEHMEASVPLEMLTDLNAMYNIDGTATVTEELSAASAQKVDLDIIEFLQRSYEGTETQYHRSFDVYPTGGYTMHPNDWMVGLSKTINYLTTLMKSEFKSYDAYYVVVGHPIDTDIIPNVDWTFRGMEDQINGIDVNYSLGAVSGSNHYKVISSDLMEMGTLYVFACPTKDNYKTFVYYPYTFNVVSNYLNTVNPSIPNIMMTRRYTIEEFLPIIGSITIKNNDGTVYAR
jgi:hypothetical protein